ncbi:MAG: DUF4276 family protein [Thiotrichales bacterium]
MTVFVPIVEGQGEVQALPALLHRLAQRVDPASTIRVNPPIRVKSGSFLNDAAYFQRQIALAAAKAAQSQGHVLILLDCDDACPATLGPDLLRRACAVRGNIKMRVILAYREYETWFLTAADSLRGRAGLLHELTAPTEPERHRDAKGWLSERMTHRRYDPIIHQLEFTRAFDIEQALANASFRRLHAYVQEALAQ